MHTCLLLPPVDAMPNTYVRPARRQCIRTEKYGPTVLRQEAAGSAVALGVVHVYTEEGEVP